MPITQSCGGGGNDGNESRGGNLPSGQPNAALMGNFLWSSYSGNNKRLDIPTGRWYEIPVIRNWIEQNKDMRNIDNLYDSLTRFTSNGRFALKVIQDCDRNVGGILDDIIAQCVVIFDLENESVISEFKLSPITGAFLESISLSDDGQYIAILDDNTFEQYRLRIYDRGGNKVEESFYANRLAEKFVKVDSLEWLPDGRLIFAYGPVIMRSTLSFSTSATALVVFDERQGEPVHLRVSPDGTKIAYALKTDENLAAMESTLWIMDVDGSNSYQLVEAVGSTQPEMKNPAWSQDGMWVVFEFGGVNATSGISPGLASGLLAVPSDAVKASVDYNRAKVSADIVRISSYYTPGGNDWTVIDDQRLRDSFPEGRVTWVMP